MKSYLLLYFALFFCARSPVVINDATTNTARLRVLLLLQLIFPAKSAQPRGVRGSLMLAHGSVCVRDTSTHVEKRVGCLSAWPYPTICDLRLLPPTHHQLTGDFRGIGERFWGTGTVQNGQLSNRNCFRLLPIVSAANQPAAGKQVRNLGAPSN